MMQSSHAREADEPASVLNAALLDQYRVRKNNLLERLINAYLEEAPRYHHAIRNAAERDQLDEIRSGAHALKSCSHNLGATRLSKVCQQLETGAIAHDMASVQAAMLRIGPECFDAEQALRSELLNLKRAAGVGQSAPDAFEKDWR